MAPRPSRIVIQTTVDPGRLPANWVGRQSEPGQGVMTPRRWRPIAATPIGGEADRRHEARRAAKTEAVLDRTRVPPKVDRFGKCRALEKRPLGPRDKQTLPVSEIALSLPKLVPT